MDNDTLYQHVKRYRRDLHRIPELEFALPKTHAYLKNMLESFGYKTKTVAKTGLIAHKEGRFKDAIAFRADMDALPVYEKTGAPFSSLEPGKMHACGHDGHMAMLLGLAEMLSEHAELDHTVVFIFQPAEETPGGARVIIEEGVFEAYHIREIYGIHLFPGLEEGKLGLVDGPMMAQSGELDVTIEGKTAHGASPHDGEDTILASGALLMNYQSIISRFLDPLVPSVLSLGTIQGGEGRTVIAQKTSLTGTIRTFDETVYSNLKAAIVRVGAHTAETFGVRIHTEIRDFYPPVINDSGLFRRLKARLKDSEYEIIRPMMLAEDFAFYQKKVPGLFIMLGVRNEDAGHIHPLHSCFFGFDERVLMKGVMTFYDLCMDFDAAPYQRENPDETPKVPRF